MMLSLSASPAGKPTLTFFGPLSFAGTAERLMRRLRRTLSENTASSLFLGFPAPRCLDCKNVRFIDKLATVYREIDIPGLSSRYLNNTRRGVHHLSNFAVIRDPGHVRQPLLPGSSCASAFENLARMMCVNSQDGHLRSWHSSRIRFQRRPPYRV